MANLGKVSNANGKVTVNPFKNLSKTPTGAGRFSILQNQGKRLSGVDLLKKAMGRLALSGGELLQRGFPAPKSTTPYQGAPNPRPPYYPPGGNPYMYAKAKAPKIPAIYKSFRKNNPNNLA